MNICNEHKSEVVYETRNCPACEIQDDLNAAREQTDRVQEELDAAKAEIEEAKGEIRDLQQQLNDR